MAPCHGKAVPTELQRRLEDLFTKTDAGSIGRMGGKPILAQPTKAQSMPNPAIFAGLIIIVALPPDSAEGWQAGGFDSASTDPSPIRYLRFELPPASTISGNHLAVPVHRSDTKEVGLAAVLRAGLGRLTGTLASRAIHSNQAGSPGHDPSATQASSNTYLAVPVRDHDAEDAGLAASLRHRQDEYFGAYGIPTITITPALSEDGFPSNTLVSAAPSHHSIPALASTETPDTLGKYLSPPIIDEEGKDAGLASSVFWIQIDVSASAESMLPVGPKTKDELSAGTILAANGLVVDIGSSHSSLSSLVSAPESGSFEPSVFGASDPGSSISSGSETNSSHSGFVTAGSEIGPKACSIDKEVGGRQPEANPACDTVLADATTVELEVGLGTIPTYLFTAYREAPSTTPHAGTHDTIAHLPIVLESIRHLARRISIDLSSPTLWNGFPGGVSITAKITRLAQVRDELDDEAAKLSEADEDIGAIIEQCDELLSGHRPWGPTSLVCAMVRELQLYLSIQAKVESARVRAHEDIRAKLQHTLARIVLHAQARYGALVAEVSWILDAPVAEFEWEGYVIV